MSKIERRVMSDNVEYRAGSDGAPGTVNLYFPLNKLSLPIAGSFHDIFQTSAFDEELRSPTRIIAVDINHNNEMLPLARSKGGKGTLTLRRDGEKFIVGSFTLPQTRADVKESIERGDVDGCSIAFIPLDWELAGTHNDLPVRSITRAELRRLTLCYEPYFPDSNADMRSISLNNNEMTDEDYKEMIKAKDTLKNVDQAALEAEFRERDLMLMRLQNS